MGVVVFGRPFGAVVVALADGGVEVFGVVWVGAGGEDADWRRAGR